MSPLPADVHAPVTGRFAGRVALVVGGASGMGAAQARRCAREGAFVCVADVQEELGRGLVAELGADAAFVPLDVTDEHAWPEAVAAVERAAGRPADVLLYNAGIARFGPIRDMTLADFRAVIDVNLVGAFLALRAVSPAMADAGAGAIVINSSLDGLGAHAEFAAYCSSKAGLVGLMRVAALELAPRGVRVNAVTPGAVDTPLLRAPDTPQALIDGFAAQIPLGHVASPEEVAAAVLFLASPDAAYVTGTTLNVDGGVMAQVPLLVPDI